MTDCREQVLRQMARHGAAEVDVSELIAKSQVFWQIGPDEKISQICIQLEEFIACAARNARAALRVMDRMHSSDSLRDNDFLTALKKYVEDTCEAIRTVDNVLKKNASSFDSLLFEVPSETRNADMSWRNLIARRNVIAHRLLTVDNKRVYQEAVRDFGVLHQLLSRIHFAPVRTDWASGLGCTPAIRGDAFRELIPSKANKTPSIGESLIFVCKDEQLGFLSFRIGRSEDNKMLFAASHAPMRIPITVYTIGPRKTTTSGEPGLKT